MMAGMATETSLGTRIKRARERLRWTQRQLADALGVNIKTIDNWENDRRKPRSAMGALEATLGPLSEDGPAGRPQRPRKLSIAWNSRSHYSARQCATRPQKTGRVRAVSAVLSKLRRMTAGAWVAAAVTGLCVFFVVIGVMQSGENRVSMITLGGFSAAVFWFGWAARGWHKNAPLHAKVDAIGDVTSSILAEVRSDRVPAAGGAGRACTWSAGTESQHEQVGTEPVPPGAVQDPARDRHVPGG